MVELIKKGKNTWGLPPDKIPGNRPSIPWTKAAEEAKGLPYDPAEAKAVQQLLIKKLQSRLNEVKGTFKDYKGLKGSKNEIAKLLKETDFNASQIFKHKNTESKAIRRALASMFSTDADFFAEKGVWKLLKTDLSRLEGEELHKVVKGLDAFLSGEKGGLVGHHTTLSAVTNVMEKVDTKWRTEFNALAKNDAFRLGERGLERVQPIVHKAFDTKKGFPNIRMVKGKIAEKLAAVMPDATFKNGSLEIVKGEYPKIDAFLDKMADISAHGKGYGGTTGFSLDTDLANLSPKQAYNNARNLFAAEATIQEQARRLNIKLDAALDKSNFTNIDEAGDFLLSKANHPKWQPDNIDSLIAESKGTGKVSKNPKAEYDRLLSQKSAVASEDVLDLYKAPEIIPNPNKSKGLITQTGKRLGGVKNTLKILNNPAVKRVAGLTVLGGGLAFSTLALPSRAQEVKDNPGDNWLKFQHQLDKVGVGLDALAASGTLAAPATAGLSLIPAAAAETGSLITGGLSLGMDATRYLKSKQGRQDIKKGVYNTKDFISNILQRDSNTQL